VKWFYNNLQRRGDCQTQRKSYKTTHFVGWVVGWVVGWKSAGEAPALHGQSCPAAYMNEGLSPSVLGLFTPRFPPVERFGESISFPIKSAMLFRETSVPLKGSSLSVVS